MTTEEQSLISVVLDQQPSESERVTSGPVRRWKREEVVVAGSSLSLSSEAWLFAGEPREERERGAVASVMGRKQGASGPWSRTKAFFWPPYSFPRFLFHAFIQVSTPSVFRKLPMALRINGIQ